MSAHNRIRRQLRQEIGRGTKCTKCELRATRIKNDVVLCAGHAAPKLHKKKVEAAT